MSAAVAELLASATTAERALSDHCAAAGQALLHQPDVIDTNLHLLQRALDAYQLAAITLSSQSRAAQVRWPHASCVPNASHAHAAFVELWRPHRMPSMALLHVTGMHVCVRMCACACVRAGHYGG